MLDLFTSKALEPATSISATTSTRATTTSHQSSHYPLRAQETAALWNNTHSPHIRSIRRNRKLSCSIHGSLNRDTFLHGRAATIRTFFRETAIGKKPLRSHKKIQPQLQPLLFSSHFHTIQHLKHHTSCTALPSTFTTSFEPASSHPFSRTISPHCQTCRPTSTT